MSEKPDVDPSGGQVASFRNMTRENRYEELHGVTMPHRDGSALVPHVAVLRCRSCGSLLLAGDEDIHELLHPRATWSDGPSLVELDAYGDFAPERGGGQVSPDR